MTTGSLTAARHAVQCLETLNAIGARRVTDAERQGLAAWPGWGPLAPAFDPDPEGAWAQITTRLEEDLLDKVAFKDASECVDNSFFTPQPVVEAVYALLAAAGFTGGRVLEPGCGSGNFMRWCPPEWDVRFVGVERDATSARVAQVLHPDAEVIHSRLENASVKSGFDAVIGNVPFSKSTVYDSVSKIHAPLHDYFVLRSLAELREGGYLVLVSSRFSLDGKILLRRAREVSDFVGAVRLPSGAFKEAGTSVVTDVLVLRKNTTQARAGWVDSGQPLIVGEGGVTVEVSGYWSEHPEHVAGRMVPSGHFRNPLNVVSDDPAKDIGAAVAALADQVAALPMFVEEVAPLEEPDAVMDEEGRREGSFHEVDGQIVRVESGTLVPVRAGAELRALVGLRDLAVALLEVESDLHMPDEAIAPLRAQTLDAYRGYVARWGALNRGTLHVGAEDADTGMPSLSWRRPTLGGFRKDPDYMTVMAMETYDQDSGAAAPAPILLRRVNKAPERIERVDTPAEALSVTLGERGFVDLARVADLLGAPSTDAAAAALGDLVFQDPQARGAWVSARDYLSGQVGQKLTAAQAAAARDERYQRNVAALRQVQPTPRGPADIQIALGNPCLTAADVAQFALDVLGARTRVEQCQVTGSWSLESGYGSAVVSAAAATAYGTPRLTALELLERALNGKAPVVYDEVPVDGNSWKTRKVRNAEQTIAAQEKTNALRDRFSVWAWEDPDRAKRMCAEYNRRFNSYVPRRRGGEHLTFPGMSDSITPHPWQRSFVDHATVTPAALCGHAVGAGKTLTMVMVAMTLRRFGLVNKPLIVVPNHLLEQIAREMRQAYPLGQFLVASKEDLTGDARRGFAARCAAGDWDAVVMTHQAFTSLPVHPRTEMLWLEEQKQGYQDHLRSRDGGYFGAKEIARKTRSLESRLERLRDNAATDAGQVLFEHLGVDYIAVDEAHMFKRLPVASRAEGFSMGASKRATDLLLKASALARRNPGAPYLGLFTGTPWTNTLAETFTWQQFCQPDVLEAAGVATFDAWASVFVQRETVVEVAPDGSGFRTVTRPVRMTNLPDLRGMLGQVADILSADDIALERPAEVVQSIAVQPSAGQRAYVAGLVDRAEKLRTNPTACGTDNMLAICGDGRRVALDPWLVGVADDSPKVAAVADEVARIYAKHADRLYGESSTPGAFQIVFCDQGTPGERGPQTYGRLRDAMVARGVPAAGIRFVHEAKDDKARAALFAACRDGSVSVLIGSTEKLGTGTNIQTRLVAVHDADAPWRPSDVDQRHGRGLRPGNLNAEVEICRYVTEGTFDAFMWQALERKALGFAAMYAGHSDVREVDDIGEVVPAYTQMKALATGNPLLMRQAEVAAKVKRLRTLRAVDAQSVVAARRELERLATVVEGLESKVLHLERLTGPRDRSVNDAQALVLSVQDVRRPARSMYRHVHTSVRRWEGLGVQISGRLPDVEVRVLDGRVTVDAFPVKASRLTRGSVERATALLEGWLRDWDAGAEARLEAVRRRLDEARERVPLLREHIDTYEFPQRDLLWAAEAELTEIEALIAVEVDAPTEAEPIAA